jgi:rare lipoprotein A
MRRSRPGAALAALALALSLAGAAAAEAKAAAPERDAAGAAPFQAGVASWYGAAFQGRPTSSGEPYDKEKLTCAHRTLPFGAYVLVRNLDNGSSVVVRVNDRGPFAKDRVIDLSEAAARIIGMIPTGTARVSLTLVPEEEALAWKGGPAEGSARGSAAPPPGAGPGASAPAAGPPAVYRIQVASYSIESNARATVDRLAASGIAARIERAGGRYRVVLGGLSAEEARVAAARLEGLGYRPLEITKVSPALP